jgi:hypothetical protein
VIARLAPCQKEVVMRTLTAAGFLVLLGASVAQAVEDPPCTVARAVQALGGADKLAEGAAMFVKVRGTASTATKPPVVCPLTGELYEEFAGRAKLRFGLTTGRDTIDALTVLDGPRSWMSANGEVKMLHAVNRELVEFDAYLRWVTHLLPLVQDRGFRLTTLGEWKVGGRPALGVLVSYVGRPDVSLYFDKESALLLKASWRFVTPWGAGHEIVYSDYREAGPVADERLLRAAKVATDGPGLVKYLRGQTADPALLEKAKALVRQLGDDSFAVREQASRELVDLGQAAVPSLRAAAVSDDREVAFRARACLRLIGKRGTGAAVAAAVRLLAWRKPAGAAEALLAHLSGADAPVAREVREALCALAERDGKPNPVLVRALADKDPVRRQAAAAALGKDGGAFRNQPGRRTYPAGVKYPLKAVRYLNGDKLLETEVLEVRFYNRFGDKVFAKP